MALRERDKTGRNYWVIHELLNRATRGAMSVTEMQQLVQRLDLPRTGLRLYMSTIRKMADELPQTPDYDRARAYLNNNEGIKTAADQITRRYYRLAESGIQSIGASDPRFHQLFERIPSRQLFAFAGTDGDALTASPDLSTRFAVARDALTPDNVRRVSLQADQLALSPFRATTAFTASRLNRAARDVQASRNQTIQAYAENDQAFRQGRKSQTPPEPYEPDEDAPKGFAQVESTLAPYITDADLKVLRTTLDADHVFPPDSMDRAKTLLRHLYDEGLDFSVKADGHYRNQVAAVLTDVNRTRVRVLDDKPKMIGRLYLPSGGQYYYASGYQNRNGKRPELKVEDAFAPIDFITGRRQGRVRTSAKGSSNIYVQGTSQPIYFKPNELRSRAIHFGSPGEAESQIETYISSARESYRQALLGADAEGFDPELAEAQKTLANQLALVDLSDEEKALLPDTHIPESREAAVKAQVDDAIGDYENGFNPAKVVAYNDQTNRFDITDRLISAMKTTHYDTDKLKGTDFGSMMIKDRMIQFDPETATTPETETNAFRRRTMTHVQNELTLLGIAGTEKRRPPDVRMDAQGIMRWSGIRTVGRGRNPKKVPISAEIGQIFAPDEHGLIQTHFGSGEDHAMIPGLKGYFQFGEAPRMERMRVQGYDQLVRGKIDNALREQVLRKPSDESNSIENGMDSTVLNKLYHGDVYGTNVASDWYEKAPLPDSVKSAIVKTFSRRTRLSNKLGKYATTFAENEHRRGTPAEKSMFALVDYKNLRILHEDMMDRFDLNMTGTNKSQGLILFMSDKAKVRSDGYIIPADPQFDEKGQRIPDAAPVAKLDEFKNMKFNAWDRNQMALNQAMTAEHIDHNVRSALMTFGGWTFDDSYVVSKEFAERNAVTGAGGELRPLKKGDKISDFGGNKGTIGLVVDRDMDPAEAKAQDLEKEVAIFKANPDLDLVGSPYGPLTRDNSGVVHELMDSDVQPVVDPSTGQTIGESGTLNIITTNMLADKKTHAYTDEDIAEGHGRKFSGQLSWAATELGAAGVLHEAFSRNNSAWSSLREYYIATGYDMSAGGKLRVGYEPHGSELRKTFDVKPDKSPDDFIRELGASGGMLKMPFPVKLRSGVETTELPILSASLRRNTELLDGEMKVHDYTQNYASIYKAVYDSQYGEKGKQKTDPKTVVQQHVDTLQKQIINDQLGGENGENSKYSYMRTHIMSRRMPNSATAVATADPRLRIGDIGASPDVMQALHVKNGDTVMLFRDPSLHSGSLRSVKIHKDPSLTGIAMNPVMDKSFDGDFDGDTYGLIAFKSRAAKKDLKEKAAMRANLLNPAASAPETYLNVSMDMVNGAVKSGMVQVSQDPKAETAKKQLSRKLTEIAENHTSEDAMTITNDTVKKAMREPNFGSARVMLHSRDAMMQSFQDIVATGAKGSENHLTEYEDYFDGKKGLDAARGIQKASGVKSDLTGVAGTFSQRLMALVRNQEPAAALEVTYPITQATLQIKHDPKKAELINNVLNTDLNDLFEGRKPHGRKGEKLTSKEFEKQMIDIYQKKLDVDLNPEKLHKLTDVLSDHGPFIKGIHAMTEKLASPMDQIAYGGGVSALDRLAKEGRSLTEGKWSAQFAPDKVLNASKETELVKDDTQDHELKNAIADEVTQALSESGVYDTVKKQVQSSKKAAALSPDSEPEFVPE